MDSARAKPRLVERFSLRQLGRLRLGATGGA